MSIYACCRASRRLRGCLLTTQRVLPRAQHEHQHMGEFWHADEPAPRRRKFAGAGQGRTLGSAPPRTWGEASAPAAAAAPPRKRRKAAKAVAGAAARKRQEEAGARVSVRQGNLLDASEAVVAHQCNCVSRGARGLARALHAKWPKANAYALRDGESAPGTIDVFWVDKGAKRVVSLFAQVYPGKPQGSGRDTRQARLEHFERTLDRVAAMVPKPKGVAMPYLIGCGLAGGVWSEYERAIRAFSQRAGINVTLYKLDEGGASGSGASGGRAGVRVGADPSKGATAEDAIVID